MKRHRALEITNEIAEREGFEVLPLPREHEQYYYDLNPEEADRCVDDRPPKNGEDSYNGMQLAAGTLAKVDSFRYVTGANEQRGREKIFRLYQNKGYRIGDHIDDQHGEITDPDKLLGRKDGCGKLRVLSEGKVKIYKDLGVDKDVAHGRIDWVRINGNVVTLTDIHSAAGAVANLVESTTLNTRKAFEDGNAMFSGDFVESARRSGELYDILSSEGSDEIKGIEIEEFVEKMFRAEITDYLQTLRALDYEGPLWVRS